MKEKNELAKKVLILNSDRLYDKLFISLGYELTSDRGDADLICFTGGTDVSPSLYGDSKNPLTSLSDTPRDLKEESLFWYAREGGIPMVGICRGAQLLCALNGGKLIQHLVGHAGGNHKVITYDSDTFEVTSSHHQMMLPTGGDPFKLLASTARRSPTYQRESHKVLEDPVVDVEAVFWVVSRSLGIQFHPEWMPLGSPAVDWFSKELDALFDTTITTASTD